jgi:hypothetical protein
MEMSDSEISDKAAEAEKLVIKINHRRQDFQDNSRNKYRQSDFFDENDDPIYDYPDSDYSFYCAEWKRARNKYLTAPDVSYCIIWSPYYKGPVFKPTEEQESWQSLWIDIGTPCISRNDYIVFLNSLYILIHDSTKAIETKEHREEKNKLSNRYTSKPQSDYPEPRETFPEKFWQECLKDPAHIFNIIEQLRHRYIHLPDNKKVKKMTYPEICKKLTVSKCEPEATKDIQKLQIEILKQFVNKLIDLQRNDDDELKDIEKKVFKPLKELKEKASKYIEERKLEEEAIKKNNEKREKERKLKMMTEKAPRPNVVE